MKINALQECLSWGRLLFLENVKIYHLPDPATANLDLVLSLSRHK